MKLLFFVVIIIDFFFMIYSNPDVKHFYIESNKIKCALLDISSDILVFYPTSLGTNYTNLNLSLSQPNQSGLCDNVTEAQFNISIVPTESLSFNFKNENQIVTLTSIQFTYQFPNVNFPDSVHTAGIFTNTLFTNFNLSNSNSFYQCNSEMQFNISKDILLKIYSVKIKVYNVVNNSFGNQMQECSQDSQNQTTVYFTTRSPESSTLSSGTTFNNSSTSTTTHTTNFTSSFSTITTIKSTYSTSKTFDTSTKSSTFTYSTANSISSFASSSVETTTQPSFSTTFNPDKHLFYIIDSKTKNVCLILQTNLIVEITYENTKNQNLTKQFTNITNDNFSGYCNSSENVLDIKWTSGISFQMNFRTDKTYSTLSALSLNYTLSNASFPDCLHPGKVTKTVISIDDNCKTVNGNGYSCSTLTYKFGSAVVTLNNFRYEAFRNSKSTTFSNNVEVECNYSKILTVTQIIAITLTGIMLILLIFLASCSIYKKKFRRNYILIQ